MIGAEPRWSVYSEMGGNTPQYLINTLAERIARGETELALTVGCEFLGSAMKRAVATRRFAAVSPPASRDNSRSGFCERCVVMCRPPECPAKLAPSPVSEPYRDSLNAS